MNRRKSWKRAVAFIVLTLSTIAIVIGGYKLWGIESVYREGDAYYTGLTDRVCYAEDTKGPGKAEHVDFDALRKTDPDVAAWLCGPDTVIDYPVMAATDYDYYLHHLPDGSWNANGTLFVDYNNAPDFSDELTVIYGHHMKSGKMFGSLNGYKNQAYYEEHPYMELYTEDGDYRIDLLYGCVIGAGEWRERAFMFKENLQSLLAYAGENTTFKSGAKYASGDKVVAMSTCSYEFDDARYVVIGVLHPVR